MAEATIRDVAQRAQVSIASGHASSTSSAMSARHEGAGNAAVDELGMFPRGARSLRCGGPGRWSRSAKHPGEFFSENRRGMDGWRPSAATFCSFQNMHASPRGAGGFEAMRGRVDGLIVMAPHLEDEEFATALPRGTPAVLVNTRAEVRDRPAIRLDNAAGARSVVEHLIATGRRRIVHISGPIGNIDAEERAESSARPEGR